MPHTAPPASSALGHFLANKNQLFSLAESLFATPELGFKEHKTSQILTAFLGENNIPYQSGLALTGLRATLGTGGYHIALVADMDAVAVPQGDTIVPFHSCGHSVQMAVMLAVMSALSHSGLVQSLGGRVSFIATPAEEYIDLDYRSQLRDEGKIRYFSGKQNMIADGVFDDVDCVLSMHISGEVGAKFDVGSTLAGFGVKKATFLGQAAHSGALPHQGRNALHAATLCLQACAFLQEQFPKEAGLQLHPILTQGGSSMNVIPEKAVIETYVRAHTNEYLLEARQKFDTAAHHSAAALGLTCEIENTVGYMPLRQSPKLGQLALRHMQALCSDDAITKNFASGASGDVGDLSFLLPTIQFGFTGFEGRIHSNNFKISDPTHVYLHTGEVLLNIIADLLAHPETQDKNPNYTQDKALYLKNWLMQP